MEFKTMVELSDEIDAMPRQRLAEAEYRRGYRDGFIQAVTAMHELWFAGKDRTYDLAWSHWEGPLLQWVNGDKSDRFEFPPLLNAQCVYCGAIATTIDHVMPKSRGGSDDASNLVPACHRCNTSKGARTPDEWRHNKRDTMKTKRNFGRKP